MYTSSPSSLILPMRKLKNGLLKKLPLGSRKQVAKKLACLVENVVQANDHHAWSQLLHFASRYLRLPKNGNRLDSLRCALNKQIRYDLKYHTIV